MRYIYALAIWIWASFGSICHAQYVTTAGGMTPTQYVQNVLLGAGAQVSNVQFFGNANTQIGTFNGAGTNLGLNSGIVLSTCQISPPNGLNPLGFQSSAGTSGYAPLSNLIGGISTNNAAVLTFNFVPQGDTIKFRYVFASSEYNSYVNSSFNDVFAFFLTGPNPAGGTYNNYNVAIVPGTANTPVTINNVNNGNSWLCGAGPCMNCQYFVDNCLQNQGHNFGGATVPLWAAVRVVPCSTYTITLAVADALDGALNSAVFLEGGSFQSTNLQLSVANNTTSAVDTLLTEGCGSAQLVITRTNNISSSFTVNLNIGGTATSGVDYQPIPTTVNFAPGQATATINIVPIPDALVEGNETIQIGIQATGCSSASSGITFIIQDYQPLVADAGQNVTLDCNGGQLIGSHTGGTGPYTYSWNNGASTTHLYNYIPSASGYVPFTVTDVCNNSHTDSVYVTFLSPNTAGFGLTLDRPSIVEDCGTATFTITRNVNTNLPLTAPIQITGSATNGADFANISSTIQFAANQTSVTIPVTAIADGIPEGDETLTITVVDTLCDGTTVPFTQTLTIRSYDALTVDVGPDVSVTCPRFTTNINPVVTGGWAPLNYAWSSGDVTLNLSQLLPPSTQQYILTVTDSCGKSVSDSMTIQVYADPVADFNMPPGPVCEVFTMELGNLSVPGSGSDLNYQWNLGNGVYTSEKNPVINFSSGTYTVELIVTNTYNCKDTVSKTIVVLPTPVAVPVTTPQVTTILDPNVHFSDVSIPTPVSWYWETGDGAVYTDATFTHTYEEPGLYMGYLHITNEYGCTAETHFPIEIEHMPAIYIPNAFTPNGDGINDNFGAHGLNFVEYEMWIFDRWGQLIYFTNHLNKPWNGSYNNTGDIIKSDVYVYRIRVVDTSGKEAIFTGNVNLIQ